MTRRQEEPAGGADDTFWCHVCDRRKPRRLLAESVSPSGFPRCQSCVDLINRERAQPGATHHYIADGRPITVAQHRAARARATARQYRKGRLPPFCYD